jgi:alginate O-acetyltransferase complex protein AlgI
MYLNSVIYLAFLAVSSLLYWVVPKHARSLVLIALGCIYYAYYSVGYLFLLCVLSLVTYVVSDMVLFKKERWKLYFGTLILVLVLVFFKYIGAFGTYLISGGDLFSELMLPLGISFYTFELIHYLAEVYKGNITTQNIKTFFAFILFFPTRVSGPIKKYDDFKSQLESLRFVPAHIFWGVLLIGLGFFQKIVIADPLIPITNTLLTPETLGGSMDVYLKLMCYSLRIYMDFAGLTNIAMGSAYLFGIAVPRNFNHPYFQPNISLFWRSWHMSLSNWVRDYIYIPLGGSRRGQVRTFFNLLVTMLILGMWHGSSLNFAVWGLYQGAGLAVHRAWREWGFAKHMPKNWFTYTAYVWITFIFVTIGWALFVTNSLGDSLLILRKLFVLNS